MTLILRLIGLAILTTTLASRLRAEPTHAPPDWDDRASVYLAMSQKAAAEQQNDVADAADTADTPSIVTIPAVAESSPIGVDSATPQTNDEKPAELATSPSCSSVAPRADRRHLAPPTDRHFTVQNATANEGGSATSAASRRLAGYGLPTQSLYTVFTGLAIVIGAFLLFSWAMRRAGRLSARRSELPADVVSVLGRVPLAPRQFAELLRVGNKLVLVSLTAAGAEPITEVTDQAEVDRLVGLCQQNNPFSTTKAFEQVFQQMSTEAAPAGFLGNESLLSSLASPAGAYRANRGGTRA